jgi:acetyltransferase-like isoleucine patch superfamily enzyme
LVDYVQELKLTWSGRLRQLLNTMKEKFKRAILWMLYAPRIPRDVMFCFIKKLKWDCGWRLFGLPLINCHRRGHLSIGKRFVACSDPKHNILGVFQCVTITVGRGAELVIGEDVGVSGCTISAMCSIRIGDRVLLGSGCIIADSDAHPLHPLDRRYNLSGAVSKPIVIEDDVFIGMRAIILKGVRVGQGSVVGAGAVVTRDVPPMVVVAGNPAVVVKELDKNRLLNLERNKDRNGP